MRFHSIFSFKYSERPNTLASRRLPDDVPEETKTRRIRGLQMLQRRIQLELHERAVGQRVEVLVDARSRRRDWEALRPDDRQHGRQLARAGRVGRAVRQRGDSSCRSQQPVGRAGRERLTASRRMRTPDAIP